MKSAIIILAIAGIGLGLWQRQVITAVRKESLSLRQKLAAAGWTPGSPLFREMISEEKSITTDEKQANERILVIMGEVVHAGTDTTAADAHLPELMRLLGKLSANGRAHLFGAIGSQGWPEETGQGVRFMAIQSLAIKDPSAAAQMAVKWKRSLKETSSNETPSEMAMMIVFKTWLKRDAKAALEWIDAVQSEGIVIDQPEFQGLISKSRATALGAGIAISRITQSPKEQWQSLLDATIMRLDSAETRREFAEAFRQESSLEEHRSNVARSLLMQVFREPNLKVAEADDLLDVLEIDGIRPIATGLMMSIGDQTEPRMEWMIKRYADHKDLPPLVRAVTSMWANTDHRAAATWITEMPTNSPIRDSAIRGFVKSIARTEPESATDWANTISDPTLRSKALQEAERVAKRWQKSRSSNE